jgi:hypothetical protein
MYRKALVIPALLLALTACGSTKDTTTVGAPATISASASAAAVSPKPGAASCPTSSTKKFAKTRFVTDLGLAFGAFHRYILKPYQAGTFKKGAGGRTKALIKGAAAGAFILNRLNAARKMVNADPTLCKSLKAPLSALSAQLGSLPSKFKGGQVDPAAIAGASGTIDGVKQNAAKLGTPIKEK